MTIIRDRLTDPMFYEEMSKLLEDLITQKHDDTESYEQFLKKAEELARKLGTGKGDNDVPAAWHGNKEAAVLYNKPPGVLAVSVPTNMAAEPGAVFGDEYLELALKLDKAIRKKAPAGWKGDSAREARVLDAIYPIMKKNKAATQPSSRSSRTSRVTDERSVRAGRDHDQPDAHERQERAPHRSPARRWRGPAPFPNLG